MKIQDLRDDLAEMRYFKKSYLRKMQQEAGGPMQPMAVDPGKGSPSMFDTWDPNYGDEGPADVGTDPYIPPDDFGEIVGNEIRAWQRIFDLLRGGM